MQIKKKRKDMSMQIAGHLMLQGLLSTNLTRLPKVCSYKNLFETFKEPGYICLNPTYNHVGTDKTHLVILRIGEPLLVLLRALESEPKLSPKRVLSNFQSSCSQLAPS